MSSLFIFANSCLTVVLSQHTRWTISRPRTCQIGWMFIFCVECGVGFWGVWFHNSPIYRNRSMAMIAVGWRFLLPSFCLQFKPCLLCLAINTTHECYATYALANKYNETSELP